jgi:hypothetical protein
MSLQADYLLEGGGGDRSVGTVRVMIGDVGNLLNDTFQVTYPVPVPAPPAPGNVLGTGTENTGGTTPMLDCCFGQPAGYQPKLGGFEVFRNNSFFVQLPPPSSGGRLLRLTSLDAPVFGWDFVHSKTGNPWGTTSDSNQFREFIVAVSDSFTHTYTALNRADWTIAIVGTRDGDHWVNNGSFIAGDDSLQPVDGLHVQVLGLSFALQNWMKYLP